VLKSAQIFLEQISLALHNLLPQDLVEVHRIIKVDFSGFFAKKFSFMVAFWEGFLIVGLFVLYAFFGCLKSLRCC